jgi:hypothetical protein
MACSEGLGKMTMQLGAGATHGCIKCELEGEYVARRYVYQGYRHHLCPHHPFLSDPEFGPTITEPCKPNPRTHEGVKLSGEAVENTKNSKHTKAELKNLIKELAVSGLSPLVRIPEFDIVADAPVDLMHILKRVCDYLIKAMKGRRKIAEPKKKARPAAQPPQHRRRQRRRLDRDQASDSDMDDDSDAQDELEHDRELDVEHKEEGINPINTTESIKARMKDWKVRRKIRDAVDKLLSQLPLPTGTRALRPFQHSGLFKMHDFMVLVECWGVYLLSAVEKAGPVEQTFVLIMDVLRSLCARELESLDPAIEQKVSGLFECRPLCSRWSRRCVVGKSMARHQIMRW